MLSPSISTRSNGNSGAPRDASARRPRSGLVTAPRIADHGELHRPVALGQHELRRRRPKLLDFERWFSNGDRRAAARTAPPAQRRDASDRSSAEPRARSRQASCGLASFEAWSRPSSPRIPPERDELHRDLAAFRRERQALDFERRVEPCGDLLRLLASLLRRAPGQLLPQRLDVLRRALDVARPPSCFAHAARRGRRATERAGAERLAAEAARRAPRRRTTAPSASSLRRLLLLASTAACALRSRSASASRFAANFRRTASTAASRASRRASCTRAGSRARSSPGVEVSFVSRWREQLDAFGLRAAMR